MTLPGHQFTPVPATQQVRALMGLRWTMLRTPGARFRVAVALGFLVLLLLLAWTSYGSLEPAALGTAIDLAPTAFLGFSVLALVSPLAAGGGTELLPPEQLVAFPVRPGTYFLGGLLLAPVNLVWLIQLLALVAETSYLTRGGRSPLGAVTTIAYIVTLSVLGQVLAWTVAGLRKRRSGRRWVASIGAGALLTAVVVVRGGWGTAVIDASPTRSVIAGLVAGNSASGLTRWSLTTAVLVLLGIAGSLVGARACSWALHRPAESAAPFGAVKRRTVVRGPLRELMARDRASVWRAPALRRGGVVLIFVPGLLAAGAGVPWESLVVLPGLVAAGAGLLFGVNAFCLDGSGALWLASLPHDPLVVARAKTLVLTETVLAAVIVAALAGSSRSSGTPTTSELTAIAASGLACTAIVVALGIAASVRRPHRADLSGPRAAIAPPGAMVLASARLALPTALVGLILGGSAKAGVPWLPPLLAVPIIAICGVSLRRSFRRYAKPQIRAGIVARVAAG